MLETAYQHFEADIARAYALLELSHRVPVGLLHDDLLRSCLMMTVGASDAYFSDAYTDMVTRTLRAIQKEPNIGVPESIIKVSLPIGVFAQGRHGGWTYRMAARKLMERAVFIKFEAVKSHFNVFYTSSNKILSTDMIEVWMQSAKAKRRNFGTTKTEINKLRGKAKNIARKNMRDHFFKRFRVHYQRRNDCIHNCDRPKEVPTSITFAATKKCIEDFEFLIGEINEELNNQFGIFLTGAGFSATTRSAVT